MENKPLTIHEVLALPDGAEVWVEYAKERWCVPVQDRWARFNPNRECFAYVDPQIPGLPGKRIGIRTYGRWYRVWLREPTGAERDVAKWES